MSLQLLQRLSQHLDDADLLSGYEVRYYRWSDQDLNGSGQIILFRMPGTSGDGAHVIQRPDIEITILCDPDKVTEGDERMLAILQYLRENFNVDNQFGRMFSLWPVGPYSGPTYLQNNRALFALVVRAVTEDH